MNKLVIGNLKMNILNESERERYLENLKKELKDSALLKVEIIICPPSIHFENFKKELGEKVKLGVQDIYWEKQGSFTGEISAPMVKNLGAEYVIIGHSERRKYFGENNKIVNLKICAAIKSGLKVIFCVGETKQEKQSGRTAQIITNQIKEGLASVSRTKAENIVVAYEPVWSVGTDETPESNDIMEAKILIRKILIGLFENKRYAEKVKIIYGGSVSSFTVGKVCLDSAMDGALIGRESLVPKEFLKIAEIIDKG